MSREFKCLWCDTPTAKIDSFCSCRCHDAYHDAYPDDSDDDTCIICDHSPCTCIEWNGKEHTPPPHKLKRRFPDYYQHRNNWSGGTRMESKKLIRALYTTPRKLKRDLFKRIARGFRYVDDLPF